MKNQIHMGQPRRGLGEGAAYACLAVAGAVMILWATPAIMGLATGGVQLDATHSESAPVFASTNSTDGALRAWSGARRHAPQPAILQDRTERTL
jgi:hypothetical protein